MMDESRWHKVETIIDQVLDLPPEKRKTYIDVQCKGDAALKGEVTQLLESIFDSRGWLENPKEYKKEFYEEVSDDLESLSSHHSLIGKQVGAYSIQKQIGEGGMGAVYLAERADNEFQHSVAIKIIRHGRATTSNIQRFKREQQILADLNHPGIATLFDGGVTDDGFLYIIMEYVEGMPIDEYCRQQNISIDDKIALFKQVLHAVRHAHENLVIHRDLKPGNILVDQSGNVKILDFGISKLLEEKDTSLTQTGARLLTPKYAAPEQIKETNITTATDLYALGVIFYELLAEVPPFDFEDISQHEIEHIILQNDPPSPSSRVNSKELKKEFRGDLDAIVLKAIRKEPKQRYRVANDFLNDLENYENRLPVLAHSDSFQYRSQKFIKRNAQALVFATIFTLLIFGFTGFYTWRITQERNQAAIESQKAENISAFLLDLFEANYPLNSRGEKVTAEQLLMKGKNNANRITDKAVKANMLSVIGKAYGKLGYRDSALALLEQSKKLIKNIHGPNSTEYASINFELGSAHGSYADLALPYFKKSYTIYSDIYGESHLETARSMARLGQSFLLLDALDSAKFYTSKALNVIKKNTDATHPELLKIKEQQARLFAKQQKYDKAEGTYLDIITAAQKSSSIDSLTLSKWNQNLAWIYIDQKQFKHAIPLLKSSLSIAESFLGKGHTSTLKIRNDLAGVYGDLGNMPKKQILSEENIQQTIKYYGKNHRMSCQATAVYGYELTSLKYFKKGETYLRKSVEICRNALSAQHTWSAYTKALLSANLEFQDKDRQSKEEYKTAYKILEKNSPEFNRINVRQISLIIELYQKINPENTGKIQAYSSLLNN